MRRRGRDLDRRRRVLRPRNVRTQDVPEHRRIYRQRVSQLGLLCSEHQVAGRLRVTTADVAESPTDKRRVAPLPLTPVPVDLYLPNPDPT
jgi:hypothetical protein